MSEIKNGKMDVMGINIDISSVLGEKIIDQYIAQISEEDMQGIMDCISKDFYYKKEEHIWNYDEQKYHTNMKVELKERSKNGWGQKQGDLTIGELIQNKFNERIKEELTEKVEEIIKSTDYQEKINEIAEELVEYAVNGYKEEMKSRLRQRLVDNVVSDSPYFGQYTLTEIIHQEIDRRLSGGY